MKFPTTTLVSLAALSLGVSGVAINHEVLESRQLTVDCIVATKNMGTYKGHYDPACFNLVGACMEAINSTTYIWSKTACVAGATCQGTKTLLTLAQCRNPAIANMTETPHLSYNVYANIVGDCAWAEGGCPITAQKYIDWFYGALSNIGTDAWPISGQWVKENWWQYILDWTLTGDTLPYTNFDDWLHYSFT